MFPLIFIVQPQFNGLKQWFSNCGEGTIGGTQGNLSGTLEPLQL